MNDQRNNQTFIKPNPLFGDPDGDAASSPGQQSYPDTCAVRCQEHILTEYWGYPIDEKALVQEALDQGWYSPGGGTQLKDVGNLLELHGVAVNRFQDASIYHLANELAQGHKVIIGVDSGELWKQHPILENIEDLFGIKGADHAVVVTGIDTTDPSDVRVIISDPGSGESKASYPMSQFLDAWKDSDFCMVSTQQPPPEYLHHPTMVNFDYDLGHIPNVAGIPYDHLQSYERDPHALSEQIAHPDLSGFGHSDSPEPLVHMPDDAWPEVPHPTEHQDWEHPGDCLIVDPENEGGTPHES